MSHTPSISELARRGREKEAKYIIEKQKEEQKEKEQLADTPLQELKFQSQCVLLENYDPIVRFNFQRSYPNFVSIHGEPSMVTTKMNKRKHVAALWNITPEQLAHLQPTFRLFKIRYQNNEEVESIELPFAESISREDLDNITNTKVSRGSGVNLKSFDWKLRGSNPAEASTIIETKMVIRFESLQDLLTPRKGIRKDGSETEISFGELFGVPTGAKADDTTGCGHKNEFDPNRFSWRAVVGWRTLDSAGNNRADLKELDKALLEDQRIFTCTLTNHNIDFSQEGPVNITFEAIARIDVASFIAESDIFEPYRRAYDRKIIEEQQQRNKVTKLQDCLKQEQGKTVTGNAEQVNKDLEPQQKELDTLASEAKFEKVKMWSSFLNDMLDDGNVYSIVVSMEKIQASAERGFFNRTLQKTAEFGFGEDPGAEINVYNRKVAAERRSLAARISREGTKPQDTVVVTEYTGQVTRPVNLGSDNEIDQAAIDESIDAGTSQNYKEENGTFEIPFIYLGDILEIGLKAIHGETNRLTSDSFQTLVGDIIIYDPSVAPSGQKVSINLADIPISLDLFKQWYINMVHNSKKGESWSGRIFLKDVIERLLVPALTPESCYIEVPQRTVKASMTYLTAKKVEGQDPIAPYGCNRVLIENLPNVRNPTKPTDDDIMEYFILSTQENLEESRLMNREQDMLDGIHHFIIGRDRGLIKSINFSRADMPYMREAQIVAEGNTQYGRLREFYQASIEMEGNNIYVPGQLIYVNPSTIVLGNARSERSIGQIMGLVGYYRIIAVESFIEAGVYKTTLTAYWEAAGTGQSHRVSARITNDACKKSSSECLKIGIKENDTKDVKSLSFSKFLVLAPDYGERSQRSRGGACLDRLAKSTNVTTVIQKDYNGNGRVAK